MNTITASQLAILLDIPKKEAVKKVVVALERQKGNDNLYLTAAETEHEKNPSIDIKIMSSYLNIDLNVILESVKKDFLKNPATGRWILDYPITKLKPSKETGLYPKSVKIPDTLRSMLSQEVINQILEKWRTMYKQYTDDFGVEFK